MGDVVDLNNVTSLDLDPDKVMRKAEGQCPEGAVVLGFDADGELYFASSMADGANVLWLLELAKKQLLEMGSG